MVNWNQNPQNFEFLEDSCKEGNNDKKVKTQKNETFMAETVVTLEKKSAFALRDHAVFRTEGNTRKTVQG